MIVAQVSFKESVRKYHFNVGSLDVKLGDKVIVETAKGLEFGEVCSLKEVDETEVNQALKDIIRVASEKDIEQNEQNIFDLVQLNVKARGIVDSHELGMKVVNTEITFDRKKLTIYYEADNRVDFRDLVRDLSAELPFRIELRQIGSRDTAKMIGGIGPCGLVLCCSSFIGNFDVISIKMAKNQNLSLNPQKISGLCGKLLCCIKFEDEVYKELRLNLPDVGEIVKTEDGDVLVIGVNILARKVKTRNPEGIYAFYDADKITRLNQK